MYQRIGSRRGFAWNYTCGLVFRRFLLCCVLSLVAAWGVALADGNARGRAPRVAVSPISGSPRTPFLVSFRALERTGRYGSTARHYLATATAAAGTTGCIPSISVRA